MGVRRFGSVFDDVAEAYDAARPGYPDELVAAAVSRGGLARGSRVLEVGCGTGKLTESLLAHGLDVDAVDPGANMVAVARRRAPAARYHVGRFEDVDLPRAFEAVCSGTAFHWVDPAVGWRKAASHLAPGGLLALLARVGLADDDSDAHDALFLDVLRRHAPEVAAAWTPQHRLDQLVAGAGERRANVSEVWTWVVNQTAHDLAVPEAAELFGPAELATVASTVDHTADEVLALLRTTSLWF